MKEITEQQIRDRANEIGSRPIYPTAGIPWNGGKILKVAPSEGMTYKMYLIGQYVANPTGSTILEDVQYVLEQLAKAELEAENNLEQ
jgi:hypothetical protein